MTNQREVNVVRIKLGPDRAAPQPDALGRSRIGYAPGLDASELWERGRGVWRARLEKVADAQLLLIASAGTVVLAGSVTGVTFHDGRVAIVGDPDPTHPLIGRPDPLDNSSANPVAYGTIETSPAALVAQRPFTEVLGDAIAVLTEAGRRRRPRLHQTAAGKVEPHPTETDPADWAEFVTLALAGAAANLGGIDAALAGRPGSWEAAKLEDLLLATVGTDPTELWRHRTEPVRVVVDVDDILAGHSDAWSQYEEAEQQIDAEITGAEAADPYPDEAAYGWSYTITGPDQLTPTDPTAPAWSWDTWRATRQPEWADWDARTERDIRAGDTRHYISLFIPHSPEAGAEYERLCAERDERIDAIRTKLEQLSALKKAEWAAYGADLARAIEPAARAIPDLHVPVEVIIRPETESYIGPEEQSDPLAAQLLDAAIESTPSPADLPGTPLDRLNRARGAK
jgi:hypothetical protein